MNSSPNRSSNNDEMRRIAWAIQKTDIPMNGFHNQTVTKNGYISKKYSFLLMILQTSHWNGWFETSVKNWVCQKPGSYRSINGESECLSGQPNAMLLFW
jgi:hypothetical protein